MKRKTSILLIKLAILPPVILIGTYLAAVIIIQTYATLFMPTGSFDNIAKILLKNIKEFHNQYKVILSTIYYGWVLTFFGLIVANVSFFGSMIYFKTGFYKLGKGPVHSELVRNNKFMFWDELVEAEEAAFTSSPAGVDTKAG